MKKHQNKFAFILALPSFVGGAVIQNREVCAEMKKRGLYFNGLIPKTNFYYKSKLIGSMLCYLTLYEEAIKYKYVVATSIAGIPFVEKNRANLIELFHSTNSGSFTRTKETIKNASPKETKQMHYWLDKISEWQPYKMESLENRFHIEKEIETICAQYAYKIIAVSRVVKNDIVKNFGIPENKVTVIYNGIPEYWFEMSKDARLDPHLFFVSRIKDEEYTFLEKGVDRALEIFEQLHKKKINMKPNFIAHTAIYSIAIKGFRKLSRECNFKLHLNIERERIADLYKKGDLFIQTSRTEACQLTLLEAMAKGLVPVTYPVGVAPEIIKNGKNGFLVKGSEEAVSVLMRLSKNKDLRIKIGEAAHNSIKNDFTFQKMCDKYEAFFKKLP